MDTAVVLPIAGTPARRYVVLGEDADRFAAVPAGRCPAGRTPSIGDTRRAREEHLCRFSFGCRWLRSPGRVDERYRTLSTFLGLWWAGGFVEEHPHARVILPDPQHGRATDEGALVVSKTDRGDRLLRQAARPARHPRRAHRGRRRSAPPGQRAAPSTAIAGKQPAPSTSSIEDTEQQEGRTMRPTDAFDAELAAMHTMITTDGLPVEDAARVVAERSRREYPDRAATDGRLAQRYPTWAALAALATAEQQRGDEPATVFLVAGGDLIAAFGDRDAAEIHYLAMVAANLDVQRREVTAEQWRAARAALGAGVRVSDTSGVSER